VPRDRSALIDSSERFSHSSDNSSVVIYIEPAARACQCGVCRKHGTLSTF
jgi:hypothetical protein